MPINPWCPFPSPCSSLERYSLHSYVHTNRDSTLRRIQDKLPTLPPITGFSNVALVVAPEYIWMLGNSLEYVPLSSSSFIHLATRILSLTVLTLCSALARFEVVLEPWLVSTSSDVSPLVSYPCSSTRSPSHSFTRVMPVSILSTGFVREKCTVIGEAEPIRGSVSLGITMNTTHSWSVTFRHSDTTKHMVCSSAYVTSVTRILATAAADVHIALAEMNDLCYPTRLSDYEIVGSYCIAVVLRFRLFRYGLFHYSDSLCLLLHGNHFLNFA